MNIPNIPPMTTPFVNADGHVTEVWYNVLNQLIIQMQQNVSNEGFKIPQQPNGNILALTSVKSRGAILYDQDNHKLFACLGETPEFKQILTS